MRAFWKGTIRFGLINIPVSLYVATEDQEISFKLLHEKDLSEIRYARICKEEDKEVPYEEIVRAYEEGGKYIVMTEDDFKKAEKDDRAREISVSSFVKAEEIESIYYDKPYFLMPDKGNEKPYTLLMKALMKTDMVAIASYTFRNRLHIGAIKPFEGMLVLNQMRFTSQLRDIEDVNFMAIKIGKDEIDIAVKIIKQLSAEFDPEKYSDAYVERLKKVISQRKSKGGKKVKTKKQAEETAKIYDLMDLLKKSLKESEKKKTKRKAG